MELRRRKDGTGRGGVENFKTIGAVIEKKARNIFCEIRLGGQTEDLKNGINILRNRIGDFFPQKKKNLCLGRQKIGGGDRIDCSTEKAAFESIKNEYCDVRIIIDENHHHSLRILCD